MKSKYGMLVASLLFYQKLGGNIKSVGFKVNPYDPCVANNMICDKQMAITWHVDDLKVSHSDKYVVDTLIQWTKETYEDVTKLN